MRKFLLALLLAATLLAPTGAGSGRQKPAQCEQGINTPRNWDLVGRDYVYFDYVLCPADMKPPQPLVRIWITTRGNGFAVEKWAQERDGADTVSVFRGKKKAYTLYRDLNAVPLTMLKAERRSDVPADMSGQPFLAEGLNLTPFEGLTQDSAKRGRKVFESADAIIRTAQRKVALLHEAPRIGALVEALDRPLTVQK